MLEIMYQNLHDHVSYDLPHVDRSNLDSLYCELLNFFLLYIWKQYNLVDAISLKFLGGASGKTPEFNLIGLSQTLSRSYLGQAHYF